MSTEHQRYSIQNQAAAIAAFAQQNDLTIVHPYRDDCRSGLRIKNRPGLAELMNDVRLATQNLIISLSTMSAAASRKSNWTSCKQRALGNQPTTFVSFWFVACDVDGFLRRTRIGITERLRSITARLRG
jgi:Resolvase, N terminal domain